MATNAMDFIIKKMGVQLLTASWSVASRQWTKAICECGDG